MIKKTLAAAGSLALITGFALTAAAADPALLGSATMDDGHVTLVSSTTDPYGAVRFDVASGTTVSDLSTLSTDFNVTDDNCGGGSPRFQLAVDTDDDGVSDGNVFVYLGDVPNFNDCAANTWVSSGELIGSDDARFDLSQFGGAFYSTYDDLVALLGDDEIVRVTLVADGGWTQADGEQTILVDNVSVDGTSYSFTAEVDPPTTPTAKDECKKGGWMTFTDPVFKNQGQCVKYFNHNS